MAEPYRTKFRNRTVQRTVDVHAERQIGSMSEGRQREIAANAGIDVEGAGLGAAESVASEIASGVKEKVGTQRQQLTQQLTLTQRKKGHSFKPRGGWRDLGGWRNI